MRGLHERVGRRQVGGLADQHPQRADQLVVQIGGGEQADHRHGRHSGQRAAVRGAAMGQRQRSARTEPAQVGLVQHDHDRPVGGREQSTVLGLERLGDHHDVSTSAADASGVTATPAAVSAAATVPRPTPSRPRTATRSGAAIRRMIGVNRGLRLCSANRVSASTKIWRPSVVPTRVRTRSPIANVGTSAGT